MRKLLFAFLFVVFLPMYVKGDYGNCIVYHAQFHLKDGTTLTGLFEYWDEFTQLDENGTNEYCNDKGIFQLFKKYQKWNHDRRYTLSEEDLGKAIVFQDLITLAPKGVQAQLFRKGWHSDYVYGYGFIEEGDIFFVDSTEVEKMTFLKAEVSKRIWLTSEIVIASYDMMNKVENQQFWNQIYVDLDQITIRDSLIFREFGNIWGFHLLNYDPQNNIAELKRLANLKLKFLTRPNPYWKALEGKENVTKKMEWMAREKFERDIQVVKDWFWERGIVMIRVNGTC